MILARTWLPTRRPRRIRVGVCAAAALAVLWAGCSASAPQPSLLILLTIDALRSDRLGVYGSELQLTPHLDALARQSIVFTAAYAPTSFTVPSVSAMMTGRYPEELGIWVNESGLPDSASTLAGELKRAGWRTLAVVSNFVLRKASGLDSGFDRYDDALPQYEIVRKWPERIAADTTDAGLAMLDGCAVGAGSKCFLWIHYQDPHGPYTPPPGLRERFLSIERRAVDGTRVLPAPPDGIGLGGIPAYQFLGKSREVAFYRAGYDAEVSYLDREIGRLLDGIAERGLNERAVIAVAADHGESLGEADYWFAHGEYLTDALVRVPLFLRVPGRRAARRDDVASLVDLYPTLLQLLTGGSGAADHRGRDLLADGASERASVPYIATLGASTLPRRGLVRGQFKWVVSETDGAVRGELFRRSRDGAEIVADKPRVARALAQQLAALLRSFDPDVREVRPEISDADREKLRALGYVDDR